MARKRVTMANLRAHVKRTAKKKTTTAKIKRVVNRMAETKDNYGSIQASFAYNSTGLEITDDAVAGLTDTTRIGQKISPTFLKFHGTIEWTSSATSKTPCRLTVIQQRNDRNDDLAYTDLFVNSTQAFVVSSPFNPDNQHLYRVLADKTWNPPMQQTQSYIQKVTVPCKKPLDVLYASATTGGATSNGKITAFFLGYGSSGQNETPKFIGTSQFNYKDM